MHHEHEEVIQHAPCLRTVQELIAKPLVPHSERIKNMAIVFASHDSKSSRGRGSEGEECKRCFRGNRMARLVDPVQLPLFLLSRSRVLFLLPTQSANLRIDP